MAPLGIWSRETMILILLFSASKIVGDLSVIVDCMRQPNGYTIVQSNSSVIYSSLLNIFISVYALIAPVKKETAKNLMNYQEWNFFKKFHYNYKIPRPLIKK